MSLHKTCLDTQTKHRLHPTSVLCLIFTGNILSPRNDQGKGREGGGGGLVSFDLLFILTSRKEMALIKTNSEKGVVQDCKKCPVLGKVFHMCSAL